MDKLADKKTKALLLVAHPDDEIIFCGGTMLTYPHCEWMVISMTDDGRPEAFKSAIGHLKELGVNIVSYKTLSQKNVPVDSSVFDLAIEKKIWEKVLRDEKLSPDIVITHNPHGEYGHGAHKLLSMVASDIFPNVWKFVYPKERQPHVDQKFEVELTEEILNKKTELFDKNYPSENYIWDALKPLMDYQFKNGPEVFSFKEKVEKRTKPKILIIIPDRFVKSSGGIGANSGPIFEELSSTYDFYVVGFPLGGTPAPKFAKDYHEVSSPFTEVKFGGLVTVISQIRYFAGAIRFPRPDLVFACDWSVYLAATETAEYFGVPLVARMSMSPILLSEQGYSFGLNLKDPMQKALHNSFCEMEIRGLKSADIVVQVSKAYIKMYEHVAPNFVKKTRLVVDGIDLPKWQSSKVEDFKLPGTGTKKIIFLGRLSEVKGIIPLCQAKVPKDVDLIFIGPRESSDQICLNAIEEKVKNEKNVYFLGALYGDEKISALRSADALIMPSYHESFGGVALEGLASGCIVISSRTFGLADFLDDNTSIYCGTSPLQIEKAYQRFIEQSDEEKKRMQNAGFEVCKKLTINRASEQLRNVFEELIK